VGNTDNSCGRLLAVSDLHANFAANRNFIMDLRPGSRGDWLLVAGDVAESSVDIAWALGNLRERFETVIWSPGNHELWTMASDPIQLRGAERYQYLVELCRSLGVLTPEDPYAVWRGRGGPVTIVPLFLLYDYTFLPPGTKNKAEALDAAYESGIVCTDEKLLHPDPYPSREAWCRARVELTLQRLSLIDSGVHTVLVNHFPLTRDAVERLRYPEFAQWCGTAQTADWHQLFRATAVVYGHLHMHGTTWRDGTRFSEVSLGYPEEARMHTERPRGLTQILPVVGPQE
jgi:3',5'-cyclic AMP phosphodiesterase CpdA